MIILNWNWLPQQTGIVIAYLGELISDHFLAIDGEHDPRNQIWHDSVGQSSCQLVAAFTLRWKIINQKENYSDMKVNERNGGSLDFNLSC